MIYICKFIGLVGPHITVSMCKIIVFLIIVDPEKVSCGIMVFKKTFSNKTVLYFYNIYIPILKGTKA